MKNKKLSKVVESSSNVDIIDADIIVSLSPNDGTRLAKIADIFENITVDRIIGGVTELSFSNQGYPLGEMKILTSEVKKDAVLAVFDDGDERVTTGITNKLKSLGFKVQVI